VPLLVFINAYLLSSINKVVKENSMSQSSKGELVVKSVATAVVATAIVEAGIGMTKTLARQPLVLLGLGMVTGYFSYKYRKEIIAISGHTVEQGRDFVVRQKNHLGELLNEVQSDNTPDDSCDFIDP
jgi:hypothetical protein